MSVRCEHCNGSGLADKDGPKDDELLDRVILSAVAIDELHAEIERLRAQTRWRDISTAPKDGTDIWMGRNGDRIIGFWYQRAGEWRDTYSSGVLCITPTHWMPLPDPP